jgi:hypothetical protein
VQEQQKALFGKGLRSNSTYFGQSYQGGIIFWLDATGQHGLIAAQPTAQEYNGSTKLHKNKCIRLVIVQE